MVRVQKEAFDAGAELNAFTQSHTDMGAVVTFSGHVRDHNHAETVSTLELEHYAGFTESEIRKIETEAHNRWSHIRTLIIHRFGTLKPGEPIVMVAVASAHRKAAFDAATFLMDYLKTDAPFWKKETRGDTAHWIEPRETDRIARQNW